MNYSSSDNLSAATPLTGSNNNKMNQRVKIEVVIKSIKHALFILARKQNPTNAQPFFFLKILNCQIQHIYMYSNRMKSVV